MKKAIMISIRPKWVAKILNRIKTIEVRKRFPADYVGWVYIYCCKPRKGEVGCHIKNKRVEGKVVARFWCYKVEPTYHFYEQELCALSCLTDDELFKYLGYGDGYGIHITKLEIFDEPREISEFRKYSSVPREYSDAIVKSFRKTFKDTAIPLTDQLTKAPQSWCYVEGE